MRAYSKAEGVCLVLHLVVLKGKKRGGLSGIPPGHVQDDGDGDHRLTINCRFYLPLHICLRGLQMHVFQKAL